LDEPTNHLDIRSIEWLERFLRETNKTIIVVSHDRFFLDRVVGRILEVEHNRTQDYRGNYTEDLKERSERRARQEKKWQPSERLDRETGRLHPTKHRRPEDQAGTVPAKTPRTREADRKAADRDEQSEIPLYACRTHRSVHCVDPKSCSWVREHVAGARTELR